MLGTGNPSFDAHSIWRFRASYDSMFWGVFLLGWWVWKTSGSSTVSATYQYFILCSNIVFFLGTLEQYCFVQVFKANIIIILICMIVIQWYCKEEARWTLEDGMARVSVAQATASSHGTHAPLPSTSRTTTDCHAQGKHSLLYVHIHSVKYPIKQHF